MERRALARVVVAGAAAALVVGISALPSGSQTESAPAGTPVVAVSGHATGAFVDLAIDPTIIDATAATGILAPSADALAPEGDVGATALQHFTAGPAPTVTLPPEGGGPFTDSLVSLDLDFGGEQFPVTGPVNVSTEGTLGAAGRAASTARIEDFGGGEGGEGPLGMGAELVEVACTSDLVGGPVGSTRIAGGLLFLDEFDPTEIPEDPAPNTVVVDDTIDLDAPPGDIALLEIRVVANEQTVGPNDITVRGLHLTATLTLAESGGPPIVFETLEEIAGETACGVVPGAEIEPTFTG